MSQRDDKTTRIVHNRCFGGFGLSKEAIALYARFKGVYPDEVDDYDIDRADPMLANVVEEMGEAANGDHAKLEIRTLPKGTLYRISDYDGMESVITNDEHEWRIA
jgi:hypothetical protein